MKLVLAEGSMLNFYLKNKDTEFSVLNSKRNLKIRVPSLFVATLVTVGSLCKISCFKTKYDSKENYNVAESMI